MRSIVLGDGPMGRAVADVLADAGEATTLRGRPVGGRHAAADFAAADVVFDFSTASAVRSNVKAALSGGCRRLVVGTTAWSDDLPAVEAALVASGAAAVVAPSFSPAVAVFLRLAETATRALAAIVPGYDPYVVEWHRAGKRDRPSGTAQELARRVIAAHPRKTRIAGPDETADDALAVASLRAGDAPGDHTLGFDGGGETLALRVTARSRRAYADGALLAARWLLAIDRTPGIHAFERVVDDLTSPMHPGSTNR